MKNLLKLCQFILYLFVIVFFMQCRYFAEDDSGFNTQSNFDYGEGIINYEFTVENLSVTDASELEGASNFEKIMAMPTSSKARIKVAVFEDGTSTMETEELTPTVEIPHYSKSPQDPNRGLEAKFTKIDRSGEISFFDATGKLLFKEQGGAMSFLEEVEWIKLCINKDYEGRMQYIIDMARKEGQTIEEVGDNSLQITEKVEIKSQQQGGSNLRTSGHPTEQSIVTDFNKAWGIPRGYTVYDAQGEIIQKAKMYYNLEDERIPLIQDVFMESWADLGNLKRVRSTSHTHYDKINLTY